jgi:protein-S-isoprenylcysteine O-methyltransferase
MNAGKVSSILWVVFGLVWVAAWLWSKRTKERAPLAARLRYSFPIVIGSYLMVSDNLPRWSRWRLIPDNPSVEVLAVLLTAVGIALAIWARFYLGDNWSGAVSIKIAHQLVRTGPYAWVRHPIYSGIIVAIFGTSLLKGRVAGAVATALFWLGFWIKSRMEEQFMVKTFGEEYVEYRRGTGALIPKLRL